MIQQALRTHIEKIVKLSDKEFDFVQAHFKRQHFAKNDFIITEGTGVKALYFILSGLVKLVYTDADAKAHIISFAMEDWWETDFQAYYTQRPASMSLVCIEETQVLALSLNDFDTLCAGLQKMEHFFLRKSIAGHIGSQQRILSFLTANAKMRYEALKEKSPELIQRIPKTQLAAYLGVSRETLSRF